ncbi:hypothetical protein FSP39_001352 [Pinctada imbricata]|uniref:Uncharacterized protein n=1 Tax=Pinctada imbricata TaxID=66713 RepID=A0AA88Y2U2_PINIB|nr:hypothetical protein FSP39_001352 [Pinctada imbricata]
MGNLTFASLGRSSVTQVWISGLRVQNPPNFQITQLSRRTLNCGVKLPPHCDHRSLETVPLTVMHIMFLRRHNQIVEAFRAESLPWDDEILYQEAKRIVIAELQHITYNEFLPRVLGVESMNRYGLWPAPGYRDTYNPNVDPRTTSGFSVAAYRFGHSLVRNVHNQIAPNLLTNSLLLQDHFDRMETHRLPFPGGNTEGFARWMKLSRKAGADRFFVDGLRNNLFPCDNPDCPMGGGHTRTLDLAAVEHTEGNVHDIDLFTGAMTERRLPGALVGPTFACIIGQQFSNYKRGDRFFYERDDPVMAFTPGKLFYSNLIKIKIPVL